MTQSFWKNKKKGDEAKSVAQYDEAIVHYRKAIEARPQFWLAHYETGDAYFRKGEFLKAATSFWDAWLFSRFRPEPVLMAARSLFLADFSKEACSVFSQVHQEQLDPTSALMYASALQKSGRAAEALELFPAFKAGKDAAAISTTQFEIYLDLAEYTEATRILLSGDMDSRPLHCVLLNKARLFEAVGDLHQSKEYCRQSIIETIKQKEAVKMIASHKKPPMLVEEASKALLELERILSGNNVEFFLAYGTLLGIFRDGEILPYDKDMDIGIFGDIEKRQILDVFANNPSFEVIHRARPDFEKKSDYNIVIQHRASDITIDLFYFREFNGAYVSGFYHPVGPVLWQFPKFKVSELSYQGRIFKVPNSPEEFCETMYGVNWREPDKFFDSVISAANLLEDSLPTAELLGLFRLQRRLDDGDFEKACSYATQLYGRTNDDWYMDILERINEFLLRKLNENAPQGQR